MIRALLQHPYRRLPSIVHYGVLTMASNVTILDTDSDFEYADLHLPGAKFLESEFLPKGLCFEEYYARILDVVLKVPAGGGEGEGDDDGDREIKRKLSDDGEENDDYENAENSDIAMNDSTESFGKITQGSSDDAGEQDDNSEIEKDGNGEDERDSEDTVNSLNEHLAEIVREMGLAEEQLSELWGEDPEMIDRIADAIENAQRSNSWGTISARFKTLIRASLIIEMDYRSILQSFSTSILSSKRALTRMRPSRRFGFAAMGSRYELRTNLLVAVDVSGSVTDKSLSHFFSVINRFFKYGIENIDVIQFDVAIKTLKPLPLKKAKKEFSIIGRGGTNFQSVADYYCAQKKYDGLIIFTDGYAPAPTFNTKKRINVLWILTSQRNYNEHKQWIQKIKRNRATYIPLPR